MEDPTVPFPALSLSLFRAPAINPFLRRKARCTKSLITAVESLEDRALLSTFTVVNNDDDGVGSLRQAIHDANANGDVDSIQFNLSADDLEIHPVTPLPTIEHTVTIDGTTQPGFAGVPLVVISGDQYAAGASGPGLQISSINSTIRGLVINGFLHEDGILIGGFGTTGISNNHVEKCYVGLEADGMTAAPNGNPRANRHA